ncbi:MAG: hypothetical protein IJW64_04115 [Clostridia bacterium]|nr:hypothetical protein [Clostridia bacterium]
MEQFIFAKDSVLIVDLKKGEIVDLIHKNQSLNEQKTALFAVKIRDRKGESFLVSSTRCNLVSYSSNVARYSCDYLDVDVIFSQVENGLNLRVNVKNKTDNLLEWVELAPIIVHNKLKDEFGGKGEIVYPYNEGCIVSNMAYRESMPFKYIEPDYPSKNTFSIFPNMIFAQFISYIADGVGVYMGMHDGERTTKHIDFCYCGGGIKIFLRTYCNARYGQDYSMPFDFVLKTFEGEWQKACDIYYGWFKTNLPKNLKKIDENDSLPEWYGNSPVVVAYPVRGKNDTDMSENGLYPYKNALPILEDIAEKTKSKVMALLMHWEGAAPWAPPYYWPPYGGESEFNDFADELHERQMLLGLYCSGMGWTQKSKIDLSYDKTAEFDKLGLIDSVCENSDGNAKSIICTSQRDGFDLCPSSRKVKNILKEEYEKLCNGKVDYVQALDQNHGGSSYFCYSDKHGHVPAPGKWQHEEVNSILSSIDKKGAIFGCESSATEPFLAQLPFSDNRYELNYYVGKPVPIYAYLYHEFVNNFMGNQICAMLEKTDNNFTYKLAYSFIAGDMLTLVLGGKDKMLHAWCDYVEPLEKTVDKDVVLPFVKTLNEWRNGKTKKFLHYGKMVEPRKIKCSKERFLLEDGKTYLVEDSLLTQAYACGEEKAQFIVNYNLNPVDVEFDENFDVYFDSNLKTVKKDCKKLTVDPLSAIMIKI